jgi:hypothetical protein
MYWDVVEVIPEPDYSLFVRYKHSVQRRRVWIQDGECELEHLFELRLLLVR